MAQKCRLKALQTALPCSSALMAEVAHTRYYHRDTVLVRRVENFLIAHGACRMDDGFDALLGNDIYAVAEWEEGKCNLPIYLH